MLSDREERTVEAWEDFEGEKRGERRPKTVFIALPFVYLHAADYALLYEGNWVLEIIALQ